MGLTPSGMQPFELDGSYVVCNGELYGFEKQKATLNQKGYTFKSDSDCEILLPMYFEYGTDMFAMLDAEFACIIYDGKTGEYIAARDPIGIRPLYYGYDGKGVILFASEAKNLIGLTDNTLTVLQHLAGDGSTLNDGGTNLEACVGGQSGHGESDLCALLYVQLLDKNDVLLDDLVLLSACSNNSKHEKHLFS